MTNVLIVVDRPKNWPLSIPGVTVVSARDYLYGSSGDLPKRTRVLNLCRSYRYQSNGYYVSLLAAARGHRAFPSITTILDLKSKEVVRVMTDDIDELMQKSLKTIVSETFELSVYFGKNLAKKYDRLSMELFNQFRCPFLRVFFQKKDDRWQIRQIQMIGVSDIPEPHFPYVIDFATEYLNRGRDRSCRKKPRTFDLAILVNPQEKVPPSGEKAISKFVKAGEKAGFNVSLITKNDFNRIPMFDALFIRETTAVNHHTFRFAQRAEAEGLVVIDDPTSIIRCTNKVYLAELMERHHIAAPETLIFGRHHMAAASRRIGFPCILKQPDSSFSQGVVKAAGPEEFMAEADRLLSKSDLIIAQAFMPTDFDWRIGVLGGQFLYACRYFMAESHWQIVNWRSPGGRDDGMSEPVPLDAVPPAVVKMALRAASLIGNSLYGIDIKTVGDKPYLIEVNDNPSIDCGIEDFLLKDQLYDNIMQFFMDAVKRKKAVTS